jgi:uncharacterized protein (DUF1330 family)
MPVFVIAQLKFTHRETYNRYQARFMEVFKQFDGRLLVADEHPEILEGDWGRDKVVMMWFPDASAATRCLNSPEYLAIATDRKNGADTVALMVKEFSAMERHLD